MSTLDPVRQAVADAHAAVMRTATDEHAHLVGLLTDGGMPPSAALNAVNRFLVAQRAADALRLLHANQEPHTRVKYATDGADWLHSQRFAAPVSAPAREPHAGMLFLTPNPNTLAEPLTAKVTSVRSGVVHYRYRTDPHGNGGDPRRATLADFPTYVLHWLD